MPSQLVYRVGIGAFFALAYFSTKAQTAFSLQKALQTARLNNRLLMSQKLNIGLAEGDLISARLRPDPILNNQTLQLMKSTHFFPGTEWNSNQNRQVWWQLTKPFQVAGQRKYKIETAQNTALMTQSEYQETERNLFLEVANKWIDVWAAYQELEILKQAKKNIDTLAIINSLRLKNQVIQQTDLLRTELLAKQYDVRLKTSAVEAMTQHYQLKYLLGITDSIRVDTSDYFIRRDIPPLDSLTKQALKNRSDIRAALAQIETAESNIKWQKSLAYPVPELGIIWNPQNSVPYFGFFGTVKLPLFDRNQGEISKAKIAKQQAAFQLSAQQLQVKTEIMSAYAALRVQQENFLKLSDMLAQSKIILSNVRYAYLKGGTTIVDFLEAQRGWLDMQTQYYEMAKMYRQKFIELFYAAQLLNQLAQ